MTGKLERLHARVRTNRWLGRFAVLCRMLLAAAFLPSGLTKVLGNRFTLLSIETPIGFFFEGLYRSGFYWRFIGLAQLTAALLLLVPRTATIGAVVYFPIILNIFVITVSLGFRGTPLITGAMLLANLYLLCWDYDRLAGLVRPPDRVSATSPLAVADRDGGRPGPDRSATGTANQ